MLTYSVGIWTQGGRKKMLKLECDRCKKLSKLPIEIFGLPAHPMQSISGPIPAGYSKPNGWASVLGKDLCEDCTRDIKFEVEHPPVRAGS